MQAIGAANSAQSELNAVSPDRGSCYHCRGAVGGRAADRPSAKRKQLREFHVNQLTDRPIFLVGYRGTGKTTVARLLAERLGWDWADADQVLEGRFGRSIRTIFAEDGEVGFRLMEVAVLDDLCKLQ